jgi:hypothetical protein
MGPARIGFSSPRTILEDFADEFYIASIREGSSGFPISQSCSMGTPPIPLATTPWTKDAPVPQTMAMDLHRTAARLWAPS